jgi:hypothetical protein
MPAAAAAAAPRGQTGIASALTNTTKTIGGTFASAVFGVVLAAGLEATVASTAAPLVGYLAVWSVCAVGGFLAAALLFFVPKVAFTDADPEAARLTAVEQAEIGAGRRSQAPNRAESTDLARPDAAD